MNSQMQLSISDASRQVEVEPRVLRYWEDELELSIPRNAMGHRYYGEKEMDEIQGIKNLKEQGFQLKAIKLILPNIHQVEQLPSDARTRLCAELNEKVAEQDKTGIVLHTEVNLRKQTGSVEKAASKEKMEQFQSLLQSIVEQAVEKSGEELSRQVRNSVIKELDYQFRMQEERQEEHFRKLDEALRKCQKKKRKRIWMT